MELFIAFGAGFLCAVILIGYVGYFVKEPDEARHRRELIQAHTRGYHTGYSHGELKKPFPQ